MPTLDQTDNSGNQDVIKILIDSLSYLSEKRNKGPFRIIMGFRKSFFKIPGRTSVVRYHIDTSNAHPERQNLYRVPQSRQQAIEEEVNRMLDLRIIQPSSSP
jgi:hypothetical protein